MLNLVCHMVWGVVPSPPHVQEPAMFDRGTRGRFLRTLFPLNLTAEPGVGSCAQPGATPYHLHDPSRKREREEGREGERESVCVCTPRPPCKLPG